MSPPPFEAALVVLGVLARNEWDAIDPALQAQLEADNGLLIARYGEGFITTDIKRHRADLSFAYGVCV